MDNEKQEVKITEDYPACKGCYRYTRCTICPYVHLIEIPTTAKIEIWDGYDVSPRITTARLGG
jgi:hypothetical protein